MVEVKLDNGNRLDVTGREISINDVIDYFGLDKPYAMITMDEQGILHGVSYESRDEFADASVILAMSGYTILSSIKIDRFMDTSNSK